MVSAGEPDDNPYAAPLVDITPLEEVGPVKAYGYAGFWLRFVAYIVDQIILSVAVGVPLNILQFVVARVQPPQQPGAPPSLALIGVTVASLLASLVASLVYYAALESSKYQGTLGKMILGLKVVDLYGRRISFGHATGRFLGKIVSNLTCYIGYIMAGFTEKKQALHDMIASTLVVKTRP